MRTISTYETELKSILATKAKYQKDTDEQKLDMSKAAVTMERQTNAAQIRLEDRDCDERITNTKAYIEFTNRRIVTAARHQSLVKKRHPGIKELRGGLQSSAALFNSTTESHNTSKTSVDLI